MTRSDDSTLDANQTREVEDRAKRLLNSASAWGRFPTPTKDILEAANLTVASYSAFDPRQILAYARQKGTAAADRIESAISKVFGRFVPIMTKSSISTTLSRNPSRIFSSFMRPPTTNCQRIASFSAFSRTARRHLIRKFPSSSSERQTILPVSRYSKERATPSSPPIALSKSKLRSNSQPNSERRFMRPPASSHEPT